MRKLVIGVVLLVGCGKKQEAVTKAAGSAEAKPSGSAEAKAAVAAPVATAPKSAVGADGHLDCDVLLAAADFEQVCKAKVTIEKLPNEGEDKMFSVCSRRMGTGTEFPFGNLQVNVYADAEAATTLWTVEGSEAKDLPGVGDKAWSSESKDGDIADTWIKVRKGKFGFWLRAHSEPGVTSPCTLAQLGELGTLIASRL
jgi:hypothetical protein